MSAGVDERHQRACASRSGRRCNCKPTFQANVWDNGTGKRIRRTFATRSAAKQWRSDAQVVLRRGTLTAERGPSLAEAAELWLRDLGDGHLRTRSGDPYKPSAVRGYEHNLRTRVLPELGHLRFRELTRRDVQRLVDALQRAKVAPATIDSALTPLRVLYWHAITRGDIHVNPAQGIEKPAVRSKIRRVASPLEAGALLAALYPGDRALWATAFYAGLRRGELVALRWEDVDLARGVIQVRRGWDAIEGEIEPKTRRGRRAVPIPAVLRDYLDEHRICVPADRVFVSDRHVRTGAERAGTAWRNAGLSRLTLHDARHTYASFMIAAGSTQRRCRLSWATRTSR